MTNIDEIKTIVDLAKYHEPSELFHDWAVATILELCDEIERLKAAGETCIKSYQKTIAELQNELAEKDAVLNEVLSYLEWREDDLIGDDIRGDGRLTARYKKVVSLIESTFKKYRKSEG